MSDDPKHPARIDGSPVAVVFSRIIRDVECSITDESMAVDLEVHFRSLQIRKSGIPIFAPKVKESTMEIRLATRVRKPSVT